MKGFDESLGDPTRSVSEEDLRDVILFEGDRLDYRKNHSMFQDTDALYFKDIEL